jgi:hypothetical protein
MSLYVFVRLSAKSTVQLHESHGQTSIQFKKRYCKTEIGDDITGPAEK